jgi:hypothetical protein
MMFLPWIIFPLKRDASSHMMSRDFLQNKFTPFSLYKIGEETKEIEMEGMEVMEYD